LKKKLYGLPENINPAFVILLGSKLYIIKDLVHKRKVKEITSKEVKIDK